MKPVIGGRIIRGAWVQDTDTGRLVPKEQYMRQRANALAAAEARSPLPSPQIMCDIEPFRNVAVDGKVVGSRSEKREMMKRHNLIEVGNEKHLTKRQPKRGPHIRESIKRSIQELSSR